MRCIPLQGLRFGEGLPNYACPLQATACPRCSASCSKWRTCPRTCSSGAWIAFLATPCPCCPQVLENLGDKPLLCTLRTQGEGGQARLSPEEYERRLVDLLQTGGFGFVDIELSCGEERAARLAELAKSRGISVVLSKHDFHQTPPKEEIAATLRRMKALGADLPKYAVMPRTPGDVLALLAATWEASSEIGPVITMSMGELGKITRAGRRGCSALA